MSSFLRFSSTSIFLITFSSNLWKYRIILERVHCRDVLKAAQKDPFLCYVPDRILMLMSSDRKGKTKKAFFIYKERKRDYKIVRESFGLGWKQFREICSVKITFGGNSFYLSELFELRFKLPKWNGKVYWIELIKTRLIQYIFLETDLYVGKNCFFWYHIEKSQIS